MGRISTFAFEKKEEVSTAFVLVHINQVLELTACIWRTTALISAIHSTI